MASSLLNKFRLKEGMKLLTVNAPAVFKEVINAESANITTSSSLKEFDQVHCFVKTKAELELNLPALRKLFRDKVVFWIYYPKGTSKIQTDLTRDNGWEILLKEPSLRWLNLVSLNDTWSAFGFRCEPGDLQAGARVAVGKTKKELTTPRPILEYIDASKKIVRLPVELDLALQREPEVADFFNKLAFSHKKEYVEWIVTAKKQETKAKRVEETINRLKAKWKNPRNL